MREIKFRAWHYDDGMLYFNLDTFQKDYHDQYGNIMQFTGLKDAKGTDIYEGDISRFNYVVKYCDKYACFALYDEFDRIMSYPLSQHDFPAIGNIYENPELL